MTREQWEALVTKAGGIGSVAPTFTLDDALQDLFIGRDQAAWIVGSLKRKRNIVLQGPPGVGKSFMAKRLAYALIGEKDPKKVEMVQFHQSYAYEDFIQGYRPSDAGTFERRDGVFYEFCLRAQADPDSAYVFIIDEVNRGNLSKILGELMLLIEADKRGPEFSLQLTYSRGPDDRFFVPKNVHLIGLMNTADRSLAMVDYALRRRFVFHDVDPEFRSSRFTDFMNAQGVEPSVRDLIVARLSKLNETIAGDRKNLGPGFQIGHSFFCPTEPGSYSRAWYDEVVKTEVAPLLREYWFDDPTKSDREVNSLLAP